VVAAEGSTPPLVRRDVRPTHDLVEEGSRRQPCRRPSSTALSATLVGRHPLSHGRGSATHLDPGGVGGSWENTGVALEPAWIGVIGAGIGAFASGIPAFGTAVVQSVSARGQRNHEAAQAKAKHDAEAAEAKAQRDHEETLRRRATIADWRAGIASMNIGAPHTEYTRTPWYETLRPYLSEAGRNQLERPRTIIVVPDTGRGLKDMFTREVDRIEREWGLRP
jgi:hypothetical protein